MGNESAEDLVQQFEAVSKKLIQTLQGSVENETLRVRARDVAQSTTKALRTSYEFASTEAWAGLELPVMIIANDMLIFKALADANKPMTISEIDQHTKGDTLLVARIVRFLAAHELIDQLDTDLYAANRITKEYVKDTWISLLYTLQFCNPSYIALPEYLRNTDYRNPTDPKNAAWQLGYNTEDTMWEWMRARPEQSHHFNNMMRIPRGGFHDALADIYPFEKLLQGSGKDDIIFVDVGGGMGQQSINIRQSFNTDRGRIVLQDLPQVVDGKQLTDVEVMSHDMMQPQPLAGARAYYFRGVCHDHSDEVCRTFLTQIQKVMNPQSRLLIHEELVADFKPSERVTRRDIAMMAQYGAMERSESQMRALLESVGLKVLGVYSSEVSEWKITEASM